MKILAIDQSTKKIWLAFFDKDSLVYSKHSELEHTDDLYSKFQKMVRFMVDELEIWKPDIVFTEDPMSLARVNPNICMKLTITLTAMIYACGNRWIQLEVLSPSQIKKVVTGKGNAKKDLVREYINKKYWTNIKSEDECDAIAIWLTWISKIIK